MDKDGYPEQEELDGIKDWPHGWGPTGNNSYRDLMDYIRERWWWAENFGWEMREHGTRATYELHTAGWSGNEDIIQAMEENHTFWGICWQCSERGGHYKFEVKP